MIREIEKLIEYADVYGRATSEIESIEDLIKQNPKQANQIEQQMIAVLRQVPMSDEYFVFYMSALIKIFEREQYLELLIDSALSSENLSLQNKDYIWHNAENFLVKHPQCETQTVREKMYQLRQWIYKEMRNQVEIHPVKKEDRNPKRVMVVQRTFLGESHAPTHSALERCYMLAQMGMEVYYVATREGTYTEVTPYYYGGVMNIIDELNGRAMCPYKDKEFFFFQGSQPVNTKSGLQNLIDFVEEINPYYILYVDVESYVADILNEICPVAALSVTFSKLRDYNTAFAMIGRTVTNSEREEHPYEIIEVPFTFELKEKGQSFTRAELGIPEDAFVMPIVGLRLDYDVSDEFLEHIQKIENGFLLFIGVYNNYEQKQIQYPWLREHSVYVGKVDEVIGRLECADLYVNPKRLGGGFSVIEAFHAGIPAVTINYGDVAAAAGKEFCVSDYDEMIEMIRRYQYDTEFYEKQMQIAREREAVMTNGRAVFERGIRQMLDSPRFY